MAKPATFPIRLKRSRRLIKLFLGGIGSLTWSQAGLFLVSPLVILVYLSFSPPLLPTPKPAVPRTNIFLPPSPLPTSKNITLPSVSAGQIFIMDQTSKVVLYQKNASLPVYPASTTKMMTALVAMDYYRLDQVLVPSRSFLEGQNIGLSAGEPLTVEQLLYALLVQSANDAAEVLAENFPGGRPAFVAAMNSQAENLHLSSTHFQNPTGLDEDNHYSSAIDLVRLADFAMRNAQFAKIVSTENSVITALNTSKTHLLSNVNQLLGKTAGVQGVKSGQTDKSGQSLVTLVERDGHPILLAVLGSEDRFTDTTVLIDWVYTNFRWVDPDMLDQ